MLRFTLVAASLATLAACVPEEGPVSEPPSQVVVVPPLDTPPVPPGKGPVVVLP